MFDDVTMQLNDNFQLINHQQGHILSSNEKQLQHKQIPSSPILAISSLKSIFINKNLHQLPTKLTDLIGSPSQHPPHTENQMIKLISSTQLSLHFHDYATSVIQKYQKNDVVFVGVWGSIQCDKNFFFDRILNLCNIQSNKYSDASALPESDALLFFYNRPFVRGNVRIFLLNCKGYLHPNQLTVMQKHQLDIMLSICQVIILIQNSTSSESEDIVEIGCLHFKQSFHRLFIDKKKKKQSSEQVCWPKSLFVLYNTSITIKKHQKSKQHEKQLCQMFQDYNFSILHSKTSKTTISNEQIKSYISINNSLQQLYFKNASIIFRQIYNKASNKHYMNVRFNGFTLPHILTQIVYTLNKHHFLYLPTTFQKAKKSIFLSIYNKHSLEYLLKIKKFITQEKSYSTDYLLNAFQFAREETMNQYTETQMQMIVIPSNDSCCVQNQKKLEDYIQQKQQNIINVNKKKSAKELSHLLSQAALQTNPFSPFSQLKKIKSVILEHNRNYDHHVESQLIGNALKQIHAKSTQIFSAYDKVYTLPIYSGKQTDPYDNIHEIQTKKSILILKKKQLQQLIDNHTKISDVRHNELDKNMNKSIINYRQRIQEKKANSCSQQKSNLTVIESLIQQNSQLKKALNQKLIQKNILKQKSQRNQQSPTQQSPKNNHDHAEGKANH